MAYLDDLAQQVAIMVNQQQIAASAQMGIPRGAAYASYYPSYEVMTPQYVTPSPYSLAQLGFRTNEIAYACMTVRSDAVSEGKIMVMDNTAENPEEISGHDMLKVIHHPCPRVDESQFWWINELNLLVSGTSVWEKERDNLGRVIRLWPMRSDWCSFLRGEQQPIRAVRYQPYGMPYQDIDAKDCIIFQYFDPLWPLLKGIGPTMVLADIIELDNNITKIVDTFIKNGAFLGGVLTTQQTIDDAEAQRIRMRWRQQHSGSANSGDIAVFGEGTSFLPTSQSFREMVFPEIDARSEARICAGYRVNPILIAAKIGMDRSTFSNYAEVRPAFYEGIITKEWNYLAGQLWEQLLPDFIDGGEDTLDGYLCQFDVRNVKALQEDRNNKVIRAVSMYEKQLTRRDESREEIGYDPIGGTEGDAWYEPSTVRFTDQLGAGSSVDGAQKPTDKQNAQSVQDGKGTGDQYMTQAELDARALETKNFNAFAKKRIREHQPHKILGYEFKYMSPAEQHELIGRYVKNIPDPNANVKRHAEVELSDAISEYMAGFQKRLAAEAEKVKR